MTRWRPALPPPPLPWAWHWSGSIPSAPAPNQPKGRAHMGKQHVRLLALVASTGELTAQLLLDSSPFLSQEAGCPQLLTFQSVTLVGAGAPLVPGLVSVQQASSIAVECGRFVHRVCVLSLRKNGLVGSSVFLGPASLTHPLPTQTHSLWTNGPSRSFRQACPHAPLA